MALGLGLGLGVRELSRSPTLVDDSGHDPSALTLTLPPSRTSRSIYPHCRSVSLSAQSSADGAFARGIDGAEPCLVPHLLRLGSIRFVLIPLFPWG